MRISLRYLLVAGLVCCLHRGSSAGRIPPSETEALNLVCQNAECHESVFIHRVDAFLRDLCQNLRSTNSRLMQRWPKGRMRPRRDDGQSGKSSGRPPAEGDGSKHKPHYTIPKKVGEGKDIVEGVNDNIPPPTAVAFDPVEPTAPLNATPSGIYPCNMTIFINATQTCNHLATTTLTVYATLSPSFSFATKTVTKTATNTPTPTPTSTPTPTVDLSNIIPNSAPQISATSRLFVVVLAIFSLLFV